MTHRAPVVRVVALVVVGAFVVASCGRAVGGHGATRTHAVREPVAATSTPPTSVPPTTTPATSPQVATSAVPRPPPTAPMPATAPTSAPAPPLVSRLAGVGTAGQVVAVSAVSYGVTVATLTAYQRTADGWQEVFGPWQAHLGYGGFAPPGQKREGDGRTPSGSYAVGFFFGVLADPGVQFPYRAVTGPNLVWDDDPSNPLYNQWVDTTTADAGASPEPMDQTPAYDYGAVIDYNTAPTVAGAGSAIFLHVSTGGATAGCVSLPTDELLSLLRWLSPGAQPRIVMGTAATIAP